MADIILTESQYKMLMQEASWYNLVGDVLGVFDPTGLVDIANGISYMTQGDHLFGLLSFISAIPYAGDVVAKPVMGALKIGSKSTKSLKTAMELSKVGKTADAAAILRKLADEPSVVGKFLRSSTNWAPKLSAQVQKLPGGLLKGFKNTILDYLKLFERAGAKSTKFATEAGKLANTALISPVQQTKNIKMLQDILKKEKIFDKSELTKRTFLSNIFLGGAPRLFGNRRMRVLMRSTKFWLGFLDYVGIGNFVGPDETAKMLGSEEEMTKKMEEYMKTNQAKEYAQQDFGNTKVEDSSVFDTPETSNMKTSSENPFGDFLKSIIQTRLATALI